MVMSNLTFARRTCRSYSASFELHRSKWDVEFDLVSKVQGQVDLCYIIDSCRRLSGQGVLTVLTTNRKANTLYEEFYNVSGTSFHLNA